MCTGVLSVCNSVYIRSPRTGAKDGGKPPRVLGIEHGSSERVTNAYDYRATFPA